MSSYQMKDHYSERVTEIIVEKVAKQEGVSPEDLTPPLYEAIDPEALDSLFDSATGGGALTGTVTFTYKGYTITVSADDAVSLEE